MTDYQLTRIVPEGLWYLTVATATSTHFEDPGVRIGVEVYPVMYLLQNDYLGSEFTLPDSETVVAAGYACKDDDLGHHESVDDDGEVTVTVRNVWRLDPEADGGAVKCSHASVDVAKWHATQEARDWLDITKKRCVDAITKAEAWTVTK